MKDYVVHPYRLAFAQGGLYLLAYVPEYKDVRTFAIDRIASVSLDKQTFTPTRAIPDDVFGNSLGVNTGPPSHVEIAFDKRVAPYVRARVWHPSQALRDAADGGVVLSLDVCNDAALRSWILGWGAVRARGRPGGARRRHPRRSAATPARNIKPDMRRPSSLRRPRRPRARLLRRAVAASASTPTGSGSARSATSRCSRRSFGARRRSSRSSFVISVLWLVFNLRHGARRRLATRRPIFTTQQGMEVALPGRQQLRTIASAIAMVLAGSSASTPRRSGRHG